jgi:putative ABC transport system permease protein
VLLMLLPVAAMAAAITLITTVSPTAEETVTNRMGVAQYGFDAGGHATTAALQAVLPAQATVEPWSYDLVLLVLPGQTFYVSARSMDLEGLAKGMLSITDGRQPHNQQEVAVNADVAELAGVGIGDSIELEGFGTPTVVGLVEDPVQIRGPLVQLDASVAREMAEGLRSGATTSWLVSDPSGELADSPYIDDRMGCGTPGCDFHGYSRARAAYGSADPSPAVLVLGGLALVEAILIAAAAFAVGVRRRQRELGLLAAAGGEPRHLASVVLSEGGLLGGIAAVGGVALGLLGIVAVSPWLDEAFNRRVGPVEISPVYVFMAGAIGLSACLLAAVVPARAAARIPVLLALSGRRPPLSPARRLLVLGLAMVALGVVLTSAGAALRFGDPTGASNTLSTVFLLIGAISGVLGFGACGPWLVDRLEKFGLRLPPSARIALRDTARARSRNGPIVTAILAAFAATVAVSAYFASRDAESAAYWQPWARADQLVVRGVGAATAGPQAAAALGALAAAPVPPLASSSDDEAYAYVYIVDRTAPADDEFLASEPTIGDAELLRAMGAESAASALARGEIVVLLEEARDLPAVTVVINDEDAEVVDELILPATVVATGLIYSGVTDAVMSPATAERLGLSAGYVSQYVIRLPRPVTAADVALAAGFAAQQPATFADAALGPLPPNLLFRAVLIVFSLLFALSVTGIAVALGEAESRPDQRTLLAIGADPGMRRRIAAARAGVLGLMAGLLAVPAGLLPAWGLIGSSDAPFVVPIPEVVAAVVILPLAGIVGALLLTRRIPSWSALREAGS